MAYDYPNHAVEQWDFAAQAAIWRERALHQAQRADFYRRLVEATKSGAEMQVSDKEPAL